MNPQARAELARLQTVLDANTKRTRELRAQLDAYTPRMRRRRRLWWLHA